MSEEECIQWLRAEGFENVMVSTVDPHGEVPEHTHHLETVQVILKGSLTLLDERGETHFNAGDRIHMEPRTRHCAHVGPEGCTFAMAIRAL